MKRHALAEILDAVVLARGNYAEAARQLGLTTQAVRQRVERARRAVLEQPKPETRGRKPAEIDWAEVKQLLTTGHTMRDIAAQLGVGASTLRRRRGA